MRLPQALLASLLLSAPALAAPTATVPQPFVEGGSYLRLAVGPHLFFAAPGTTNRRAVGHALQMELRFSLFERLALSGFLMASAHRPGSDYVGLSGGAAQGDFTALSPGVALRLNLIGVTDSLKIRRLWVYAKVGAGYSLFWPRALLPSGALFVLGGLGIEYRTFIRHFSIGLEAVPAYYPSYRALSGVLMPTLQFAF